jgi:prevent-host-death family protein
MGRARIGVRELKDNLSATLARVRGGVSVTVTDRSRPVAIIVPAGTGGEEAEAVVRLLVKGGRLAWSGGKPTGLRKPPVVHGTSVADAVVEDRR